MKGGQYFCNSYEHDETGLVTEDPDARARMAEKRLKKYTAIENDIMPPHIFGDENPDITFVTWGSTTGPVLEAASMLRKQGRKIRVVQYAWLYPFPAKQSHEVLSSQTRVIAVEQNATGQLCGLICEHTGFEIKEKFLKYNGRPFYPEEIIDRL